MARFPATDEIIKIQQDNAGPHINPNNETWRENVQNAETFGWKIKLLCKPPNSPDLNIDDLGFFRAIDSLQQRKRAETIDELVAHVTAAYEEYDPR